MPDADAATPAAGRSGIATETLTWHPEYEKPDSDLTVLLWHHEHGYLCGWWDDFRQHWHEVASGGRIDGITHWAAPEGPSA
jgi:hypothetical protein